MQVQKPSILTHTGVLYTTSDDGALRKLTEIEAPLFQLFRLNKTKNRKKIKKNLFSLLKVKILHNISLSFVISAKICRPLVKIMHKSIDVPLTSACSTCQREKV